MLWVWTLEQSIPPYVVRMHWRSEIANGLERGYSFLVCFITRYRGFFCCCRWHDVVVDVGHHYFLVFVYVSLHAPGRSACNILILHWGIALLYTYR